MKYATGTLLFGAALYNALETMAVSLANDPYRVSQTFETALQANNASHLYTYPTDFTRGIIPKFLHSHNDYWRDVPFYSALSVGAVSVEADVWLINGTLHVGHEISALTDARTFDALYVQPILRQLKAQNLVTKFVTSPTRNGVFDTDSGQTLYLWVDLKTDGATTFPAVIKALEPLRHAGYLTNYSKSTGVVPGPVTVIGTGNTPLNQVQGVSPRDYFFDGPLATLATSNITKEVSPIASVDFKTAVGALPNGTFSAAQLHNLTTQIAAAKAKGIGTRYWDLPGWPVSSRNRIWTQLWAAGVTLINVDDLIAGAGFADQANNW